MVAPRCLTKVVSDIGLDIPTNIYEKMTKVPIFLTCLKIRMCKSELFTGTVCFNRRHHRSFHIIADFKSQLCCDVTNCTVKHIANSKGTHWSTFWLWADVQQLEFFFFFFYFQRFHVLLTFGRDTHQP